jgi:hypothetical protein
MCNSISSQHNNYRKHKQTAMKRFLTIIFVVISIRGFSQQPIFATASGGELYSFDLINCTRHLVGLTGQGFTDIALTSDGQLWGISGGCLYHIDTSNASTSLVGTYGLGGVSLAELNDSTLLFEEGMKLYGLRTTNAIAYYIDTIGFHAAGDLTWYDDDLYMVTYADFIVKMVFNTNYTALLSVTLVNSNLIPICEGAATASFVGDYNSIVGFNGPNIYKICQLDGSYQMLCPNLNVGGTPGAASIRLATQVPPPTSCTTTGIENVATTNLFSIFPNPATNQLNIKLNYNQKFNFNIYNSLGQLVKSGIMEINHTTIYIGELKNGIYSIELSVNSKKERKCFIVEKSCR